MRPFALAGVVFGLVLTMAPAVAQVPSPAAVPLTSLAQLAKLIGAARIIGIGEAEHGVEDFLAFRNRFVEYSVEKLGVTAIAAETGYNESTSVDDYIQGNGDLAAATVSDVFAWSQPAAFAQNRTLLEWLRAYNARPTTKQKVHFYGLDLTGGRGGRFTEGRQSIDAALAYLATVDQADAAAFRTRLDPLEANFNSTGYSSLTPEQRDALTASLDDLIALFERRAVSWSATSADGFERAYHSAIVARELDQNFRGVQSESNPQAQREPAMADNLQWILRQAPGRVLVYEANWHISKGPMKSDRFGSSLGEFLHQRFGANYVAIATAFGMKAADPGGDPERPDPASVSAALSSVCRATCLLDLRRYSASMAAWFSGMHAIQGGRVDLVAVKTAFDAVVFMPSVRSATQL